MEVEKTKIVFISYSWDNDSHKEWVLNLAKNLFDNGIDVILDQYELSAGHELTYFMERAMTADKIVVILTPNYKLKADKRDGGVGYEYSMITQELYDKEPNKSRILPVLRLGNKADSCPTFMQTRVYHDMTIDDKFNPQFFQLVRLIEDKPSLIKPAIGKKPDFGNSAIPDIDKTIIDYQAKKNFAEQKSSKLFSEASAKLFLEETRNIVIRISEMLDNYKNNFGLHFYIKKSSSLPTITFSTVDFTFHFSASINASNTAHEAYIMMNLFKGPVGFEHLNIDYWEKPEAIYRSKYKFDLDKDFLPIFVKEDNENVILTPNDVSVIAVRELITNDLKLKTSKIV